MNSPVCINAVRVRLRARGKKSVKRNESPKKPGAQRSHFMSLQTGILDSRSLAYFSWQPAAKADYYPTASALGFPLPDCFYWNMTESCRMHAAAGDMGMYCLALIALPLCNQES